MMTRRQPAASTASTLAATPSPAEKSNATSEAAALAPVFSSAPGTAVRRSPRLPSAWAPPAFGRP